MHYVFLTLALMFVTSQAPVIPTPQFPAFDKTEEKKEPTRKLGDYRKVFKTASTWTEKLADEKFYSNFKFKNKKTGEVKKLEEMDKFDKDVFIMMMGERLGKELLLVEEKWKEELAKFDPKDKGGEGDVTDSDETPATRAHVEQFVKKIEVLRKAAALKWEAVVEKVFADHADKFSADEKELYFKTMREFHDKHKLIQRKK